MAFELQRFVRQTEAFNSGAQVVDAGVINGPALYTYESATDALATIAAASYFNTVYKSISVGDFFMLTGTDASSMYIVASINLDTHVVTLESFSASGVVGTANITDLAVTTAKIATDAVTTAKILADNVTLAKLASGIAPSHVVKFAGASVQVGGSATVTITVTGLLSTDLPFCQIGASANAVNVQKVTATANTLTILCSADPGASTLNYQALRAAA